MRNVVRIPTHVSEGKCIERASLPSIAPIFLARANVRPCHVLLLPTGRMFSASLMRVLSALLTF
jgi:hypothetical protein